MRSEPRNGTVAGRRARHLRVQTRAQPRNLLTRTSRTSVSSRRLLGAFYTPDELARTLTEWALAKGGGSVLDPSFGGCAFLRAAVQVLRSKRVKNPQSMVHGVDIDPKCKAYARELIPPENHTTADFLRVRPEMLRGAPFAAIVGNPPYVRHHWLKGRKRIAARSATRSMGMKLPRTSSTWAYFVLHALQFLGANGRMALLVPEAILQSQYGRVVRRRLQWRFARVQLIHIRERVFSDTDEPVVVVAAEGRGPGRVQVATAQRVGDVVGILNRPPRRGKQSSGNGRSLTHYGQSVLDEVSRSTQVRLLGDLATIHIGFVTGANRFFVRPVGEVTELGIPKGLLHPVVGRSRWLCGLEFTPGDHVSLTKAGRRTLLIRPTPSTRSHPAVQEWVAEGVASGVARRHKCEVREPWYEVRMGRRPDAFVTCSRLGSPLLVLNRTSCRCTNAIHSLHWKSTLAVAPEAIAVAFLSSVVTLFGELRGRRYGGGVLKVEPGVVVKLPIPVVSQARLAFDDVDCLLRGGREDAARELADQVVLRQGLGLSTKEVTELRRGTRRLLKQRVPSRHGVVHA